MKKRHILLFLLTICCNNIYAQGDSDLPIIEDFETDKNWMWAPWLSNSNGTTPSTKTVYSALKSKFGLKSSGDNIFRTDSVYGTPGQVISWWIRFAQPTHAHCGFGIDYVPNGFYLCVDPSTNTLHFARSADYTYPFLKSVSQTYKMNMWYRVEVVFNTATNVTGKLYRSDGKTLLNSITLTIPELVPGGIAFRAGGKDLVDVDNIRGGNRLAEIPFTPKPGERIVLNNIQFENDKSTLLPQSFAELNTLAAYLKGHPKIIIEISGHTDNTGNEPHNKDLSQARAKAVATYLIQKGIDKNAVHAIGYGSSKPITTNNSAEGRQKNRRVEFIITQK